MIWLIEYKTGVDVTERLGQALAILLILAVIVGVFLSFMLRPWE